MRDKRVFLLFPVKMIDHFAPKITCLCWRREVVFCFFSSRQKRKWSILPRRSTNRVFEGSADETLNGSRRRLRAASGNYGKYCSARMRNVRSPIRPGTRTEPAAGSAMPASAGAELLPVPQMNRGKSRGSARRSAVRSCFITSRAFFAPCLLYLLFGGLVLTGKWVRPRVSFRETSRAGPLF